MMAQEFDAVDEADTVEETDEKEVMDVQVLPGDPLSTASAIYDWLLKVPAASAANNRSVTYDHSRD
jgi:hypothetical protein